MIHARELRAVATQAVLTRKLNWAKHLQLIEDRLLEKLPRYLRHYGSLGHEASNGTSLESILYFPNDKNRTTNLSHDEKKALLKSLIPFLEMNGYTVNVREGNGYGNVYIDIQWREPVVNQPI